MTGDARFPRPDTVFEHLGLRPVINASGIYTDLGGSRLSPRVWKAMEESNRHFVRMVDLLDKTGERIAKLLGAEAARVTPGAAAGIVLGSAAAMAGTDGEKSERLPDTTGMKSEVLIQKRHRYKYDRQVKLSGARLKEIGGDNGTNEDEIAQAIGATTAAILHPSHLDGRAGTVGLERVAKLARAKGVPVIVDAAYMNYPTRIMGEHITRGADLVCISAKYFGGPNAGGFVMGSKRMVDAVANVHFTRYESGRYLKFGRPLKLDRQMVVAVTVALEEWLATDHEARLEHCRQQVALLQKEIGDIAGLKTEPMCFTMDERFVAEPVNCLVLRFDSMSGTSPAALSRKLAEGDPSILAVEERDLVAIVMDVMSDGEVMIVADRIRRAMAAPAKS